MTNSRKTPRSPVQLIPGPGTGPRLGGVETLLYIIKIAMKIFHFCFQGERPNAVLGVLNLHIKIRVVSLTLTPLTWKIRWAPNNTSRWYMGCNTAFKGLMEVRKEGNNVPTVLPLSWCPEIYVLLTKDIYGHTKFYSRRVIFVYV